ncbi:helix-turn-helix domain-containing protein [Candidatus Amarolinea dominans]|uniref:helix-turn-helix domain-containing protein n=1 Tax=Candidatus Amarolinea dominans TaxID=3140696 RepID=UPI0031348F0B|nr:helix-turn-helix domain-containing protein [Anaerolineae bacterium]
MNDVMVMLGHWQLDMNQVRDRVYWAPTPRERERWHALWLLACGWSAEQVAEALERDARTIAGWLTNFRQKGPQGMTFEQTGGSPPPSTQPSKQS